MESTSQRMVYVGAGSHRMEGFIHAEINIWKEKKGGISVASPELLCDVTERIPVNDGDVDFVYSRATLEHFTYRELINHLLECYRILRVGGVIRACVPDFDKFIRDFQNGVMKTGTEYVEPNKNFPVRNSTEYFIYRMMYHDHFYLHNETTLTDALTLTGFTDITVCEEGKSRMPLATAQLTKAEAGRAEDHIIIEARKSEIPPTISRFPRDYPQFWIYRILAKYFNIQLSSYIRNRPMFPTRSWFRELVRRFSQNGK